MSDKKKTKVDMIGEQILRGLESQSLIGLLLMQAGRVVYINRALTDFTGFAPEDMIGHEGSLFLGRIYPEDQELVSTQFRKRISGDPSVLSRYEFRVVHKSGSVKWLSMYATQFDVDSIQLVVAAVVDITDRKLAEELHRRLEARLQQKEKVESLALLAGGMAHDFRNMLGSIRGCADLARRQLSGGKNAGPSIDLIIEAADQAAQLSAQMLAFSGKADFDLRPVNLNEIIGAMEGMIAGALPPSVTLIRQLSPDIRTVAADPVRIEQVVLNLVVNAAEAIGAENSGVVTIRTGIRACDRALLSRSLLNGCQAEGDYLFIEVSDTGIGMDEKTMARIFDPFFSTKTGSRGLGLPSVLGIVRGHHGAILVDSLPGKGSSFKLLFPALAK